MVVAKTSEKNPKGPPIPVNERYYTKYSTPRRSDCKGREINVIDTCSMQVSVLISRMHFLVWGLMRRYSPSVLFQNLSFCENLLYWAFFIFSFSPWDDGCDEHASWLLAIFIYSMLQCCYVDMSLIVSTQTSYGNKIARLHQYSIHVFFNCLAILLQFFWVVGLFLAP